MKEGVGEGRDRKLEKLKVSEQESENAGSENRCREGSKKKRERLSEGESQR